jgi:hypothetical protein
MLLPGEEVATFYQDHFRLADCAIEWLLIKKIYCQDNKHINAIFHKPFFGWLFTILRIQN